MPMLGNTRQMQMLLFTVEPHNADFNLDLVLDVVLEVILDVYVVV